MPFLDLFKKTPKWRHADPEVRRRAVAELPAGETSLFLQLAGQDPDAEVRRAALGRIGDWRLLAPLAARLGEAEAGEINQRLDRLRFEEILAAQGTAAKRELISALSRDDLLAEIVLRETDLGAKRLAVELIAAQEVLADLACQNCGKAVGLLIVDRVDDGALLARLADEASSRAVRARAQQRAADLAAKEASSPEAHRQDELDRIASRAATLAEAGEVDAALTECRRLQRRLRELAADDELGSRLERLAPELSLRQREAAARQEARRAEKNLREAAQAQAGRIVADWESLALAAEGREEGLSRLKSEWASLEAEADGEWLATFREPLARAEAAFAESGELLARERAQEAELLAALAQVEARLAAQELEAVQGLIADLQARFDAWHPRLLGRQQVAAALAQARERRQEAVASRAEASLAQRRRWLDELRALIASDELRKVESGLKEIADRWRQPTSLAPGAELEDEFAALARQASERMAALRQQEEWRRWHNQTRKLELIEAARALDGVEELALVFKRLKELQEGWRLVGPALAKEERGLWLAFKEATDRNFARCREFFQARDQEVEARLAARAELVELAVARQDSEDWRETAEFMRDLQARWKASGPVPRDRERELFAAFRAAADHFFARRQAYLDNLEAGREENRAHKEALCLEAEGLADRPELEYKTRFKDLQARWQACGPAPKGQEEPLWQRFRAACDRYYAWLDTLRPENLARKEVLCREVEELTADLRPETNFVRLGKRIIELQRRWREIGPVPEGQAEALWQRFKGGGDRFFAAKAARESAIDQARPANQERREALLAKVKELAAAKVSRETVRELIACQEEWWGLGPGDKARDRELRQEFAAILAAFFAERREAAQEIDRLCRENIRRKEALCLRLEMIAGVERPSAARPEARSAGGLTLAEQLKLAFETNFVLAAGQGEDRSRRAREEIEQVRREWQGLGPAPPEHEHWIRRRYTEALAAALKRGSA